MQWSIVLVDFVLISIIGIFNAVRGFVVNVRCQPQSHSFLINYKVEERHFLLLLFLEKYLFRVFTYLPVFEHILYPFSVQVPITVPCDTGQEYTSI